MKAKILITAALALGLLPGGLRADWLVLRDGARVETRGPWQVKAGQVIFTQTNGTLSSLRLRDVDLEASRTLTEQPAPAAPEPEKPAAPKEPVMVITDREIQRSSSAGLSGPEALIERFKTAQERQDMPALLRLVNLEGASEDAQRLVREQLQWAIDHTITAVAVEPLGTGDVTEYTRKGVTYRPNVEIKGKLVVHFEPGEDSEEAAMSFLIGTRLGSYFIGVAAPVTVP